MPRATELHLDPLERRDQPSVFGVPWVNAQSLTLSFAPDGVQVAPYEQVTQFQQSQLFAELNGTMPTATWQFEILKAFQTWAAAANINIGLVADNGAAFGPEGADFNLAAGGELRLGAVAQSSEVAGISIPYHLLSGNRAGDVLLNTAQTYTVGGANGTRDLYSVMLNEAANALGLDDNTDSTSARYGRYTGVRTGISTADRTAIIGLYGARKNDALEGANGNSTFALATPLTMTLPAGSLNTFVATADGSIASTTDIDTYRITTRGDTNTLQVRLRTAGRSLFTGRVEVFNAAQQLVISRSVTNPLAGDINFTLSGVARNANYFVRVTPARTDSFGVGTYRLQMGLNGDPQLYAPATPPAFVDYGADNGTKDWIHNAQPLAYTTPGFAAGTRYTVRADFEGGANEHDTYSVTVPATGKPVSVVIDPGQSFQFKPEVFLWRAGYSWIDPLRLVASPDGRYVVQSRAPLVAGETIYIEVRGTPGSTGSGRYQMTVDFNTPQADSKKLAEGTMATWNTTHLMRMSIPESTFFHFSLEAWRNTGVNGGTYGTGSRVRMDILNGGGQVVSSITADSGLNSTQVFLAAGTYTVRFTGLNSAGQVSGGAWYQFRGARLSDPIDVYDPNDQGTHTPPVTVTYLDPADDQDDMWYLADPWSDPIG
jgi:hypothetical protein